MGYKYSDIDRKNLAWFKKDDSRATLLAIKLTEGKIRGLNPFELTFEYPISVIAGKNGSGKSTILAMCACAFHNKKSGYKLPWKKNPYYTFSDFLIQSTDEVPPDGIKVLYLILHNNWTKSERFPDGKGAGWQSRHKRKGGKWNDYDKRVSRNVIFLGIERVVPHSEKSVSKSYKKAFALAKDMGWEETVKEIVSKILKKNYDEFHYKSHFNYRLPIVRHGETTYSGFNMGAGENALFEIFSIILACPQGALLILDEIELGLHESAQKLLIRELKSLCLSRKIQVICTTHSPVIINSVPPEGRVFVESFENITTIIPKIAPSFAGAKLSDDHSDELEIFVEDVVAKNLLLACLPNDIRMRTNIIFVGSSGSVIRQMAAEYKKHSSADCIAILDGDQTSKLPDLISIFQKALETSENPEDADSWVRKQLGFFPGDTWPEKWILTKTLESDMTSIANELLIDINDLKRLVVDALRAEKHNEFYSLSSNTSLEQNYLIASFCKHLFRSFPELFVEIVNFIKKKLEENDS